MRSAGAIPGTDIPCIRDSSRSPIAGSAIPEPGSRQFQLIAAAAQALGFRAVSEAEIPRHANPDLVEPRSTASDGDVVRRKTGIDLDERIGDFLGRHG